jgi:hypothetical protein
MMDRGTSVTPTAGKEAKGLADEPGGGRRCNPADDGNPGAFLGAQRPERQDPAPWWRRTEKRRHDHA